MPPKKQPRPEVQRLAKFIENSIEQAGLTIAEFAGKAGFKNPSTIYQITDALVIPKYLTMQKVSAGLRAFCNVKASAEDLMAMIEAESEEVIAPPASKRSPEILTPSAVLWHLQRIAADERREVWPEVLKLVAADFTQADWAAIDVAIGRKPAIDVLIMLVNTKADQEGLTSLKAFVEWMFGDSQGGGERAELAFTGLQIIFLEKRLPYQDAPEFGALMGKLATVLDFQSDIQLLTYRNLLSQPTPKTLEKPINIAQG